MKSVEEYLESLRQLKREAYVLGEKVDDLVGHPIVRPSTNSVAMTYHLPTVDEYRDLATATSHLTGKTINRFTHIQQSTEDLINKVKLLRLMGKKTASCFQRCAGLDAMNATYSVTYDIDQKYGTKYHQRFRDFLEYVQEKDLVCDAAMTDPKGNRRLSPHEQADPDLYLHIVERQSDGVVVRGAKAHQTGALNSHEILVVPTVALQEGAEDYAIAFAVPADTKGVSFVYGRQPSDTRKMEKNDRDVGNQYFGGHEALIIFDDVFVPWERVFICGEKEFASVLVERFAAYHRASYGGCKVGVGDVLIGTTSIIAQSLGTEKASHVKDKLIEMVHLNETLYAGGISSSCLGTKLESGNFFVDKLLANVCKLNVTRFPFEIARLAQDICGGLMVTLPSAQDFELPGVGEKLVKYFHGPTPALTEEKLRAMRLLENLTLGPGAACYLTESIHGAGSPQAQKVMIGRFADLEGKQMLSRKITSGIDAKDAGLC